VDNRETDSKSRLASHDAAVMEDIMATVIEFHIPDNFFSKRVYCIARTEAGKVIEFRLPCGKGSAIQFRERAAHDPHVEEGTIPMRV
jgi:hypothetical protein